MSINTTAGIILPTISCLAVCLFVFILDIYTGITRQAPIKAEIYILKYSATKTGPTIPQA